MGALFSFGGRVGRSAYWGVIAATIVLYAGYVAWAANLAPRDQIQMYRSYYTGETKVYWGSSHSQLIYLIFAIAAILLMLVGLSVGARRWHDLGKSGWWGLISVIPLVGPLYVLVMLGFVPGAASPNRYGPAPRRSTASSDSTDERIARPHDPLSALPVATIVSLIGSAITVFVLRDILLSYSYRYGYGFGAFSLVSIAAAFLAWLVSSRYGPDLLDQLGFRRVSIIADIVCAVGVIIAGIAGTWFNSFWLNFLFVFPLITSRVAALTAYRSMTPRLAARFGKSSERVDTFFDSFLFGALLIVPFLVSQLQNLLWHVFPDLGISDFMWLYAAFFAFSAILVAVTIPADAPDRSAGVVPDAVPESNLDTQGSIEDAMSWN